MPPSPKSSKRPGAPKAKGAVRAKSGCYTCRIRRKKCDEEPNIAGDCKTCVRLHLECLGFGAKRPEWLRESRIVTELREKIKNFLAAQGMIKGTSGSGPRLSEHETPILRLTEQAGYTSSSASPPTPVLALPDPDFRPVSSERDHPYTPLSAHPYGTAPGLTPLDTISDPAFAPTRRPLLLPDDLLTQPFASPLPHSHNIVNELSTWPSTTSYSPQPFQSRASWSSFGSVYNTRNAYEDDYDDLPLGLPAQTAALVIPPRLEVAYFGDTGESDGLVYHYMNFVLKIEYLLADFMRTRSFMADSIHGSSSARQAVCLLAEVHQACLRQGEAKQENISNRYRLLQHRLLGGATEHVSEDDAMAGLHIISSFLFSGGEGEWQLFLNLSCRYCRRVLRDPRYGGVAQALLQCTEVERFIIKTTIWFDVLAAVSLISVPFFLAEIRELFDPRRASIDGQVPEELDMMTVMGCQNHIVWAMAEISNLVCWKADAHDNYGLSMLILVDRGKEIEHYLRSPGLGPVFPDSNIESHRYYTSEIFRASARVYLHSVISGDMPRVPEMGEAVNETVAIIQSVPEGTEISRNVIRSVVFSLFICGCLTNDMAQRDYLMKRLRQENKTETVGNCAAVRELVKKVWEERSRSPNMPVRWKEALKETTMLLV